MKPSKIIGELRKLAKQNGGVLQPESVVEAARPKNSPLHNSFTWDDSEAAHQYRIWQARQLIRVSVELVEGIEKPMDVFVSLTPDRERDGGGYRVMTTVLSDAQMRKQLLRDALNELNAFRLKYERLKELAGVFSAIRKARKKIG